MSYEFPIVKITLQGMEHSINHTMTKHLAEMDEQCRLAVESAIKNFDYAGEVRRMASDMIRTGIKHALERELTYGPSYEAVKKVAGEMIRKRVEELGKGE